MIRSGCEKNIKIPIKNQEVNIWFGLTYIFHSFEPPPEKY
jgi:hypothetical protein